MPSRRTCLLACLCAVALVCADYFWRFELGRSNGHIKIQPSQQKDSVENRSQTPAVSAPTAKALSLGKPAADSLTQLLRATTAPGDPVAMRAIESLAQDPAQAVAIGRRLLQDFPDRTAEIGTLLIGALVRASAHAEALELAQIGPDSQRTEWMTLVLSHWAQSRSADASLIADLLREKGVTPETFDQVAKSWAISAPEPLARYALNLPPGAYRSSALNAALDPWIQQNPAAVASCLPQITELAERDHALSQLATHIDEPTQIVSQAIPWAEAIANPELRRTTLSEVIRGWFDHDPGAASHYLLANPNFDSEQRQSLLASLAPRPDAL